MAVNTYKAQLNYYDHTYGWGNVGTCAQGDGRTWGAGFGTHGRHVLSGPLEPKR